MLREGFQGQSAHDPLKFLKRGRDQGHVSDPLNFWVLNADISNTVKATE